MVRIPKNEPLTEKDMTLMREQDSAKEQHKQIRGAVRDYTHKHRVEILWDLNEDCIKDKIFMLRIDDKEVLLDTEQVMRYLRWV